MPLDSPPEHIPGFEYRATTDAPMASLNEVGADWVTGGTAIETRASASESRTVCRKPAFNQRVKLIRFMEQFVGFSLSSHGRVVVIDDVSLPAASVEVVGQ